MFAVKYRERVISDIWKNELYKYITGIVQSYNHKVLAINGVEDHVHLFFGMRPTQSLSDLMKAVKENSSLWINKQGLVKNKFNWQGGYGAFAYSKSSVKNVINYIRNQEEHHRKQRFIDEYKKLLIEFGIDYDERYIFKPLI